VTNTRKSGPVSDPDDVIAPRVAGQEDQQSSVSKAARLLRAFPRDGRSMTGVDLARTAGLTKSTTHRLIHELEHEGMIKRDGSHWALSWDVFELGMAALRHQTDGLIAIARPWLVQAAGIGARSVVHLAVAHGEDVVLLDKVLTSMAPRIPTESGGRLPGATTASGQALGLRRGPTSARERPDVDAARSWATVRQLGVCVDYGETFEGVGCVAAPITIRRRPVAAVSISGRMEQLDVRAHVQLVTWAARRVSEDLRRAQASKAL
jgi:DNA-binding IclR family transcriptional regulator